MNINPSSIRSLKAALRKHGIPVSEYLSSSMVRGWGNRTEGIVFSKTARDFSVRYGNQVNTNRTLYDFSFFWTSGSWGEHQGEMSKISHEAKVVLLFSDLGVEAVPETVSGWGVSGWRIVGSEHTTTQYSQKNRNGRWKKFNTSTVAGNQLSPPVEEICERSLND